MDRRDFLGAAALLLAGAAPAGLARAALLPANPVFGRSFEDLQGKSVPMSAYAGQPVLMNFWASWCAPCVREMPLLESLHHDHPDVTLLGLAIDTRANVQRFLEKVRVSYPLFLAGPDGIALMRDLGNKTGGLPFSVLFNRDGRVVDTVMGELKPEVARGWLTRVS